MKNLLSVSKIIKVYNQKKSPALDEVSFKCKQGETLAIIGSSGSGKTTLLRIIAGLDMPDSGKVILNDKSINDQNTFVSPEERDCSLVFQDYALFPNMTVRQNVSFGKNALNNPKKIQELLELTKIDDLENRFPHEISGGQQQRVALVRALATSPSLLLMDEPLSHLDQELRENVRSELINLFRKTKMTVLFVSHDTEDAMAMADNIVVLNNGKVDQIGTPIEIYSSPVNQYVALLFGKTNLIPLEFIPDCKHHFFDSKSKEEVVSVRPHQLKITNNDSIKKSKSFACKVISIHYKGAYQEAKLEFKKLLLTVHFEMNFEIQVGSSLDITFKES